MIFIRFVAAAVAGFVASYKFNDARNSQYVPMVF